MTGGFVILAEFDVAPEHVTMFLDLVRENAAALVRDEPGCRRFDVLTPEPAGGRITLYEIYDDRAAFDAHLRTPHFARFDDDVRALVRDKLVRRFDLDEYAKRMSV